MDKPFWTSPKKQKSEVREEKVSSNELSDRKIEIPTVAVCVSILLLSLTCLIAAGKVFASDDTEPNDTTISPAFPNEEIIDPNTDWIDLETRNYTKGGDRSTDIESVDYFSDGKTLNATLWLYFPFKMQPRLSDEDVNYGMYIDADFDESTGYGGIDYKVELGWNNQSKQWTKVLEKWSHFGEELVLDNQTLSPNSFSKPGAHYVRLSTDLDAMLSPKKYKVVFYGEVRREGSMRTDFTRSVAIPPLELTVSTSPNSVDLRKGEQETIEVRVNTTQGYEPRVNLIAKSQSKNIVFDFTQNDTSNIPVFSVRIPSYGVATVPLTITSTENSSIGPYTLFIFANSSFPPEELIKPEGFTQDSASNFLPHSARISENIFTQSSLAATLLEPLTAVDQVSIFWEKLGAPISFFYGILAGISPWIYTKIKERVKNNKNKLQNKNNTSKP
jgi:hypothetical protein